MISGVEASFFASLFLCFFASILPILPFWSASGRSKNGVAPCPDGTLKQKKLVHQGARTNGGNSSILYEVDESQMDEEAGNGTDDEEKAEHQVTSGSIFIGSK